MLALTCTSATLTEPPLTVVASPGTARAPAGAGLGTGAIGVGEAVVAWPPAQAAPTTTGSAGLGLRVALCTVRQRLSMTAVLPAAPLTRQKAATVWVPAPSGMTAVTARPS